MKIIGGRDYYDSALAYGADPDVVFVRDKDHHRPLPGFEQFIFRSFDLYFRARLGRFRYWSRVAGPGSHHDLPYRPRAIAVIVAGKIYRGIEMQTEALSGLKPAMIWAADTMVRDVGQFGFSLSDPDTQGRRWRPSSKPKKNLEDMRLFFTPREVSSEQRRCLIDKRITIATIAEQPSSSTTHEWRINGDDLKSFGFMKVLPPAQCNQEIAMWVGGILPRPAKPMVTVSDKIKIHKHGFDEWSFRKMPEKAR